MTTTIRALIVGWVMFYCANGVIAAENDNQNKQSIYNQWSWEKNQSDMKGLVRIGSSNNQSSDENMIEYKHSQDEYRFDGIKLIEITYAFWKNRLYSIKLKTKGETNFYNLKNKIVTRFNHSKNAKMTNTRFVWLGANTITRTSYNKKTNVGHIDLICHNLIRKIQLSKCLPSNVYSSWLKQKRSGHR